MRSKNILDEIQESFSEILPGILEAYAKQSPSETEDVVFPNGAWVSIMDGDGGAYVVQLSQARDFIAFRVREETAHIEYQKNWQEGPQSLVDFSVEICGYVGSLEKIRTCMNGLVLRCQPQDIIHGPLRGNEKGRAYYYFPGLNGAL